MSGRAYTEETFPDHRADQPLSSQSLPCCVGEEGEARAATLEFKRTPCRGSFSEEFLSLWVVALLVLVVSLWTGPQCGESILPWDHRPLDSAVSFPQ